MSETTEQPQTAIATVPKERPAPTKMQDGIVRFEDVAQAYRFAEGLARSGMVPKDYSGKPEAILAAMQLGGELGFSPMQALQSIAVINGRPSVWGDGLVAVALASGLCEDMSVRVEGTGDKMQAVATVKRKGIATPFAAEFSVENAKKAGLWGKAGPWASYPERMLKNRARAFAIRDAFADMLRGIGIREEVMDYGHEIARTPEQTKTNFLSAEDGD